MARKHINDDGEKLDCSTTPDNCDFSRNGPHLEPDASPEQVEEFNQQAEKVSQQAAQRELAARESLDAQTIDTRKRNLLSAQAKLDSMIRDKQSGQREGMLISEEDIEEQRSEVKRSQRLVYESNKFIEKEQQSLEKLKNEYKNKKREYAISRSQYLEYHTNDGDIRVTRKQVDEKEKELDEVYGKLEEQRDTMQRINPVDTDSLVNRPMQTDEVSEMNKRFFSPESTDARFNSPKVNNVEELLEQAKEQRGDLYGDDRERLISSGADPSSVPQGSNVRYLKVDVPGETDTYDSRYLSDETPVRVESDPKTGDMKFVAVDHHHTMPTHHATIVVGTDEKDRTNERVLAVYPGSQKSRTPTPIEVNKQGVQEGTKMTVAEIREKFGDITINADKPAKPGKEKRRRGIPKFWWRRRRNR